MKLLKPAALILTLFGLLTLFMSGSVIFGLFGIREKEGNYVLFIVVTNFVAGILYLFAAYGFFYTKTWAIYLLTAITGILIAAFVGLLLHINSGSAYEVQTLKAMIFRISLTALLSVLAWRTIPKNQNNTSQ